MSQTTFSSEWEDDTSGTYTLQRAGDDVYVTGRFFTNENHELQAITNETSDTSALRYTLDALRELQNKKNIALAPNVELTQVNPHQSEFFTREELIKKQSPVGPFEPTITSRTKGHPYPNFVIQAAQVERNSRAEASSTHSTSQLK